MFNHPTCWVDTSGTRKPFRTIADRPVLPCHDCAATKPCAPYRTEDGPGAAVGVVWNMHVRLRDHLDRSAGASRGSGASREKGVSSSSSFFQSPQRLHEFPSCTARSPPVSSVNPSMRESRAASPGPSSSGHGCPRKLPPQSLEPLIPSCK